MGIDLENKVTVLTGGASGIGCQCVLVIFSAIALKAMSWRTQQYFYFRPRPDLSAAASCR